jgi:phage/plasmid-associated DNA primase
MTQKFDNLSWITGLREVFVKDPTGNRVGYFDDVTKAVVAVAGDGEYRAVWFSLNVCPQVPAGFEPNRLYKASGRFKKTDYARRQLLLIDCDPKRPVDTSSTDAQKAAAEVQVLAIREYLRTLGFPEPVFADSGNGFHLIYALNEANDESTEKLVKDFLAGLSAKFSNNDSAVDTGNFEANRICKLYSTVARKGGDPSLWRRSSVLSVPTRQTELPAKAGGPRETAVDLDFEPVSRALLQAAVAELPVPRDTVMGNMSDNDIAKVDWLRKLCGVDPAHAVAILKERRQGKYFVFDIVCPRATSHGSTTGDSSTTVSYARGMGYGFSCLHGSCSSHGEKDGISSFKEFRKVVDPTGLMSNKLQGLPDDTTHAKVADYIAGLDVFKNHLRIYDSKKMRTTFVGTRWDLVGQDDLLLMKAIQPICDRLRYDMPEPAEERDYRRVLESHPFRQAVVEELKPRRGVVRFDQLDANPYLIGMPGGMVADLRPKSQLRKMERKDFITKRLQLAAENIQTPVYDYFLRSISSANDQPADLEWMSYFELLHGYFLIGHCNHHVWPLWTGVGGNGKSENAKLIKRTLGDFCAVVRWSELTHDERGGDNTTKRLYFKLLQSRVALVEEMGETTGISRVLETSTIKQLTGGGEIIGADLYSSEVTGEIKFKLVSLMNVAPRIEPDAAFKRRVRVIPFRARFDELANPGCIELAMERKAAPRQLRESPHRLSMLLAEERPGILYKWIQAAQRFVANGEELGNIPSSVRDATAEMFHESDIHGRVADRLEFGEGFDITKGEVLALADSFFRENGRDPRSFDMGKMTAILQGRHCTPTSRLLRNGQRKEGWRGVRSVPNEPVVVVGNRDNPIP